MIAAAIAALGALAVAGWQYGGYLSALRRRLNQELEILSKMPPDLAGRAQFQRRVEQRLKIYLEWWHQPWWRRIQDSVRLGPDSRFAAPIGSPKSVIAILMAAILAGTIAYGLLRDFGGL
jgi:hypothetical protein